MEIRCEKCSWITFLKGVLPTDERRVRALKPQGVDGVCNRRGSVLRGSLAQLWLLQLPCNESARRLHHAQAPVYRAIVEVIVLKQQAFQACRETVAAVPHTSDSSTRAAPMSSCPGSEKALARLCPPLEEDDNSKVIADNLPSDASSEAQEICCA
eukprot:CAMPEP_0183352040 /NCGR_PEP_ID=MMETSP0164_2-20130417/27096_1 /TAXON_ID=221442 /ORGANISM="Coccolithus pelagicus ssp braarudi, Strain PLY182g" /LENGTH=154 /DNA_ID=CAMNT_0025524385 /DNA_START=56 /DNA_END=521 /DNA_ORIENTATION=+